MLMNRESRSRFTPPLVSPHLPESHPGPYSQNKASYQRSHRETTAVSLLVSNFLQRGDLTMQTATGKKKDRSLKSLNSEAEAESVTRVHKIKANLSYKVRTHHNSK